MGILDDLKHKAEELGDKAKEGLDAAKDKAGDLLDDAKERFGQDDETSPLTESSDIGPDSSSTDAVQPGYVTAEDDVTEESDESSLAAESEDDLDDDPDAIDSAADPVVEAEVFVTEPVASSDVMPPAAAELDPVDLDAAEDREAAGEPAVETDVDPYDHPLTETIGDSLVDRDGLDGPVDPEQGARS